MTRSGETADDIDREGAKTVKINGTDVSVYKAWQWNVVIGNASVSNDSTWARGSPAPVLFGGTLGFKSLQVTLLVIGESREEIGLNVSNLLAGTLGVVDLELDGFSHRFRGYLAKSSHEEKVLNRWHKLTLEFQVYEYGAVVEQQGTFSGIPAVTMAVSNPGNILTPIRLEITPTAGIASLTISGVCMDPDTGEDQPISLKNLTTGNTVVLDGETGLVTEKGALKSKDTEMWTLPALSPGTTTLTCSTGTLSIRVKLYPRYM